MSVGSGMSAGDDVTRDGPATPEGRLRGRLIGLGVTGSIAAYKSVELLRLLRAEGAEVVVMLTPSAARFVAPLTLAALSGHAVDGDVLALQPDGRIGHIVVADSADALVVAPATAHWLAAMANGLAGDAVTAACLASSAPVVVAPAMDGEMYAHPATQANVRRLRDEFGYTIVEPEAGPLASGQVGIGRLADLAGIVDAVVAAAGNGPVRSPDPASRPPRLPAGPREADLEGRRIVVTAGGTAEPIDPVRSITNRSSGKTGVAIAAAAMDRGASVTLIAAHVAVPLPEGARIVRAGTTAELREAVLAEVFGPDGAAACDALVMAAAVADFRPAMTADRKLVRGERLVLELEPTEDILAEVGRRVADLPSTAAVVEPDASADPLAAGTHGPIPGRADTVLAGAGQRPGRPLLVGFAAETGSLDRAAAKLERKGVDLLVANDVSQPDAGFGVDTNRVTLLTRDGHRETWPLLPKREVADRLLDRVAAALDARDPAAQTVVMQPARSS
jgi:phosphopantothenoylcysteine decarboxylase/phosphopantothenate--cysteine ligase